MYEVSSLKQLPITIDHDIMSGTPVFTDTRVPIQTLFDYLIDGCALAEFLNNFPSVSKEAVLTLLAYASEHQCVKVQELGWSGTKNGVLLARAEGQCDVFLTGDKNLQYQQNMKGRSFAILVLPSNKLSVVKQFATQIVTVVPTLLAGTFVQL